MELDTLGKRIVWARTVGREEQGLKRMSQAALARALGMTDQSSLWKIENTDQETSSYVGRISEILDVRPSWLESGQEPVRSRAGGVIVSTPSQPDDTMLYQYMDPRCARGPNAGNADKPELRVVTVPADDFADLGISETDAAGYIQRDASMGYTLEEGHKGVISLNENDPREESGAMYGLLSHGVVIVRRVIAYPSGRMLLRADSPDKETYPDDDMTGDITVIGRIGYTSGRRR